MIDTQPVTEICETCRGTGLTDALATCETCNGYGAITRRDELGRFIGRRPRKDQDGAA